MDRNRRRTRNRNYNYQNYYTHKRKKKKATVVSAVAFLCVLMCTPMFLALYQQVKGYTSFSDTDNKDLRQQIEDINGEYFDYQNNQGGITPDELNEDNFSNFFKKEVPPAKKPKNAKDIIEVQYEYKQGGVFVPTTQKGLIKNVTDLSNSKVKEIVKTKPNLTIQTDSKDPQVLVYHTHTSESFEKFDLGYCDPKYNARSFNESENMVSVGNAIATKLNNAGIVTIHDKTIHDREYNGAYSKSRETIKKYLKKYPSIQVILDIHRDAIQDSSGVRYKPTTTINGRKAAQVMIIAGCNGYGVEIPNYQNNLRFANSVQNSMETLYPTLTRPILFDYRFYNQDLAKAAILIEVGGHANTLSEAIYTGELVGESLVKSLKGS